MNIPMFSNYTEHIKPRPSVAVHYSLRPVPKRPASAIKQGTIACRHPRSCWDCEWVPTMIFAAPPTSVAEESFLSSCNVLPTYICTLVASHGYVDWCMDVLEPPSGQAAIFLDFRSDRGRRNDVLVTLQFVDISFASSYYAALATRVDSWNCDTFLPWMHHE